MLSPFDEALAKFSDLRLELDRLDFMRYHDDDKLYWLINLAEEVMKERHCSSKWTLERERYDLENADAAKG